MGLTELNFYIDRCVTHVAPETMVVLVKTESNFNYLAIGINGGYKLKQNPRNLVEATSWVNYLDKHGYNFDVGLGQINIRNIRKYGYKPSDMLNPCTNLSLSSYILYTHYHHQMSKNNNSSTALLQAISAYNTGNYRSGFINGYVSRFLNNVTISQHGSP